MIKKQFRFQLLCRFIIGKSLRLLLRGILDKRAGSFDGTLSTKDKLMKLWRKQHGRRERENE